MAGGECLGPAPADLKSPFCPGENIICTEKEAKLFEKIKKDIEPPIFLGYKESLEKLHTIITVLFNEIENPPPMSRPTEQNALLILLSAFIAQYYTIKKLNDEVINCCVPWDQRTGLPTHSTIIADAQKFCELFRPPPFLELILCSLFQWTLFTRQEFKCCCGRGWKMRTITIEIMINFFIGVTEKDLVIKQIVGIKSDDRKHLQEHYDRKRGSRTFNDLVIVGEEVSAVCMEENRRFLQFYSSWYSNQFAYQEFRDAIQSLKGILKALWQE